MNKKEKLDLYIAQIDTLKKCNVDSTSNDFEKWKMNVERLLLSKYGADSYELQKFSKIEFSFALTFYDISSSDTQKDILAQLHDKSISDCQSGLEKAKNLLMYLREDFDDETAIESQHTKQELTKIFIIHGHDSELKESVARIIEKQGIQAIILSEKANQGKTIIEKIEKYSDVGAAICLFSADDVGKEKSEKDGKLRARQNVVLETGYFMGKLGRDRVIMLTDDGVELPSDLSGMVYTRSKNDWQIELLRELKAMGFSIDFNILGVN